jgi:membrane-associated phospholipid phosphatase
MARYRSIHQVQANIASIVRTQFWFKLLGTSAFIAVFFAFYIYLLKNAAFPVVVMPTTFIDSMVPFTPMALPVYISLWFYVSLPVMLLRSRAEIVRYGCWIGGMCAIALTIFYFFPNAVPPADIDWSSYPSVAFLKHVDAAGNACPSLHVATAVFSAMLLHHSMTKLGLSRLPVWLNVIWCAAIAYSTLATKQHVAIDMIAGAALGAGVAWCAIRRKP